MYKRYSKLKGRNLKVAAEEKKWKILESQYIRETGMPKHWEDYHPCRLDRKQNYMSFSEIT